MKQKRLTQSELDALLNDTAAVQTEALRLDALLPAVYEAAQRRAASARPHMRWRPFAIAMALVLMLAAAVPAFAQTVIVEGKRYVAFMDAVEIEGTIYALDADAPDTTPLVRLPDSVEYIRPRSAEETEKPAPVVYVLALEAEPLPLKNPAFVSQHGTETTSLAPGSGFSRSGGFNGSRRAGHGVCGDCNIAQRPNRHKSGAHGQLGYSGMGRGFCLCI